jgi:membrane protease YdiL (CAAX protease family)
MTAVLHGRSGLGDLWRQTLHWRVHLRWYAATLVGIPLLIAAATLLTPGALASFSPMEPVRWLVTYAVVFVLTSVGGGALFEEIGWRGFALPRMQAQLGPLRATLVLGLLWSVWHLPQYMLLPEWVEQNGGADPLNIGAFIVLVMALAPLMTWLFNHTHGSVLMAILAHSSVNTGLIMVPSQLSASLGTSLLPYAIALAMVAVALTVGTRGRLGQSPAPTLDTGDCSCP